MKDNCRLGRYIKTLTINGEAILTKKQIDGVEELVLEDIEFQSKEFSTHLVDFLSALKGYGYENGLTISIDTDHYRFYDTFDGRGFYEGHDMFEITQVLMKVVLVCFGHVDLTGLVRGLEWTVQEDEEHEKQSLFQGNASTFRLAIDGDTPPGFNSSTFKTNMQGLKKVTILECQGEGVESPIEVYGDKYEQVIRGVLENTGATELKLAVPLGEYITEFSLDFFAGPRLTSLELCNYARFRYNDGHAFQRFTGLRELTLNCVALEWSLSDSTQQPWETVFVDIATLPLKKLQVGQMHSHQYHLNYCDKRDRDSLALISARDGDFAQLKMLVAKVLESNGSVAVVCMWGTKRRYIHNADEMVFCMHKTGYYQEKAQCPEYKEIVL